jgi:hypothetical protein
LLHRAKANAKRSASDLRKPSARISVVSHDDIINTGDRVFLDVMDCELIRLGGLGSEQQATQHTGRQRQHTNYQ